MARAPWSRSRAEWFRRGGSSAVGRFGKRIEQRKLGGRFARLCRLLIIGDRCGATGCSTTGALGCNTGSDATGSGEGGSADAAAGCISSSGCACASRGVISAMLPAAIRTPWLPSGKSNREQPQVASPPGAAPNPCRRSSRMAPSASSRPASRATCRRCRSAGPKVFSARAAALAAPNSAGAGRIGPQDPRAVGGPQPGGQAARRIGRQSRIARAPATEIPHPSSQPLDRPASGSAARMPTALSDRYYRKPAAAGPRPGGLAATLAMDNLTLPGAFSGLDPSAARRVGWLQSAVKGSRWGTFPAPHPSRSGRLAIIRTQSLPTQRSAA